MFDSVLEELQILEEFVSKEIASLKSEKRVKLSAA
jgi:hypothetical protein